VLRHCSQNSLALLVFATLFFFLWLSVGKRCRRLVFLNDYLLQAVLANYDIFDGAGIRGLCLHKF